MADPRRNGEPGELIYLPATSWQPVLLAAGIAAVVASLFTWWPYGVIGAVVALLALRAWIAGARRDFSRLPREQHLTSAVIPAVPLRRSK